MGTADTVLLERWQRRGDADAFAELVQRYSGMVHAACRRVLGDAALAEDVAQECFIELMRSRARIRVSLGAWLHTMATRRALDRIKGDARRRRREEQVAAVQPQSLEAGVEMAEVLACLDEAIAALPAKYREVVVARFLDGEPHTAVAQRLGIAESTVRYRVNEAVGRLRDHLKRRGVVVTLAGLTAVLEMTAEAAPPAFVAKVCKLAVASGPPVAGVTLFSAGLLAKSGAALALAAALVTGAWVYQQQNRSREAPLRESIPAPVALAVASSGVPETADGAPPVASTTPVEVTSTSAIDTGDESAGPFSIRGRVYDADTGTGIAGARLRVFPTGGGPIIARSEPTGPDGVYRFVDLGDGAYSVSPEDLAAYPDPRGSTRAAVVLKDGQPVSDIDFALKKGVFVAGTVLDRTGKPVPGAAVGAKSTRVVNPIHTETDAEGRFTIYMPDATTDLMVQAQGAGFESLSQAGLTLPAEGLAGLVLTLDQPRTAAVSGVILDGAGAGVPGAQVRLNHKTERVFKYAGETSADEHGVFQIAGCAAGDYGIIVTPKGANGYSGAEEYLALTLAEGEQRTGIEIVYGEKGGLAIAGRVVDSAGKPVPKVTVTCYGRTMERAYTGEDGSFIITGLDGRESSYGLDAEHHDYSRARVSAAAGTLDLEIVLKSRGRIEGRVLRADTGAPLASYQLAYIQGRVRGWGGFSAGATDLVESADGTLALPNLNAGDLSMAIYAPGFAPEWQCVQVKEGEPTQVEFRLRVAPAFSGIVVNERGEPMAGAFVYYAESVSLEQMDRNAAARTDASGHFTIDSMLRDLPRLCAYADGYGVGVAELPGDGRIVLPGTATINGAIALGDLDPNETNINYYYPDTPHLPSGYMRPNPDGTFQLTGLTPGYLSVSVYPNAAAVHRGVQHNVWVDAGKTANLEFVFAPGNGVLEGVLSAAGEPVSGAFLRLERRQGGLSDYMRIRSSEDGSFRFEDAWTGDLVLQITRVRHDETQELVTEEVDITLLEGEVLQQDIELAPL